MKLAYSKKGNVNARRKSALARLKKQLADGVKNTTEVVTNFAGIAKKETKVVPLTDGDRKRITTDIKILESRI